MRVAMYSQPHISSFTLIAIMVQAGVEEATES